MLKRSVIFILGCVLCYYKNTPDVQNLLKLASYLLFVVAQSAYDITYFLIVSSWPIIMFIIFCAIPKCFQCIYQFAGFVNWVSVQIFYALCGFTRPEMTFVVWIFIISTLYLVIDTKFIRPRITRFIDQREVQGTTNADVLNTEPSRGVDGVRHARLGNNDRQQSPQHNVPRSHSQSCSSSSGSDSSDHQLSDTCDSPNMRRRHRGRNTECVDKAAPPTKPPDDSSNDCIVCCERPRNVALFPCGHTQLCHICVAEVRARNSRCPICQTWFKEFRTIYL